MTQKERLMQAYFILRKELRGLFETPIAYIVTILFVVVSEILFFRSAFLIGEASLAPYVDFLPWLLMFVIPALTMGVFANEREGGTYETLATRPVSEREIVGGKFFAIFIFVAAMLALAIGPIAVFFSFFGALDWGATVGAYIASLFLSALFIALGMFSSSLFSKQVTALLVAITGSFAFTISGLEFMTQSAPLSLALLLDRVSALTHFSTMARGAIDLRDVWYFLSVIAAFIAFAQYRLLAFRFARNHPLLMRWRVGIVLIITIALVSNVLGSALPGRLDLTAEGRYTLSSVTKTMLGELDDVVHITLYASAQLPAQFQPVLRDTRDLVKDYERYGKGNVVTTVKDPDASPELLTEAMGSGIQPVQFNMFAQGEVSLKKGYLGVVLSYAGKEHAIPFVEHTNDLEYQLSSAIAKLRTKEKKNIRFLTGHGEPEYREAFGLLAEELEKTYNVSSLPLTATTSAIATTTSVLIIAEPKNALTPHEVEVIRTYAKNGGGVLALMPGVSVDQAAGSATPHAQELLDLFAPFGVSVDANLVYDLRSHEIVQFASGGKGYLTQYPFWIRALSVPFPPILSSEQSILVPWGSSIVLSGTSTTNATATPLIVTSPYAGSMSGTITIAPNQDLPQTDLSQQVLAVAVHGTQESPLRMVIVGNASLFYDQMVGQDAGNAAFSLASVAWLAQDESLASIKIKGGTRRTLVFGGPLASLLVEYGSMLFGILVPLLIGTYVYVRRRTLKKYTYTTRPF